MAKDAYIIGKVIEGRRFSRTIGFPTLNITLNDNCKYKYGVYAGLMEYNDQLYCGVLNIGITPHFEVNEPKLEIHIFNFTKNLYGKQIKVIPVYFLREEMKFDNIDNLIKQIKKDCVQAKNIHKKTYAKKLNGPATAAMRIN